MAGNKPVSFIAALSVLVFASAVQGNDLYSYEAKPARLPQHTAYEPQPTTPYNTHAHGHCPHDALKLQVCASLLHGLVEIELPEYQQKCCPLLHGLVGIDAAACLCTVLKVDVPVSISLLLNQCGRNCPSDFTCPQRY